MDDTKSGALVEEGVAPVPIKLILIANTSEVEQVPTIVVTFATEFFGIMMNFCLNILDRKVINVL